MSSVSSIFGNDAFLYHTLYFCLQEDPTTRRWLQQLLHNVGGNRVAAFQAGGGFDHMLVN